MGQGSISFRMYLQYARAGAHYLIILFSLIMLAAGQVAFVMVDWWLAQW